MTKRSWLIAIGVAIGAAAVLVIAAQHQQPPKSIRIGYGISLSGPNAAGASLTLLPNYRLWAKEVNAAGGLMLKSLGKRLPVEIIEYDDESNIDRSLDVVKRLIEHDKVDFLFAPWGTGPNLAVGPLFHRAGYPHLVVAASTDRAVDLIKLWPGSFWFLGTIADNLRGVTETMGRLRAEGRLGGSVALVSIADQFGIEFAKAARRALTQDGFNIVYDRTYAVGDLDMRQMLAEAKATAPDAFLAFSYPPDTLAITEQARDSDFNPKLFYTGVGTAFTLFRQRIGADTEGVMGTGGWSPETQASRDYLARYIAAVGQEPDQWGSPLTYASLEMLQQAIERVGSIDRAAVVRELQTGSFVTIVGTIKLDRNIYRGGWLVGQWQNGAYHGIAPATLPGARAVLFPKPAWGAAR